MIKICTRCHYAFSTKSKATHCNACYIAEKKDERQQLLSDVIYWQTRCFNAEQALDEAEPPAEQFDSGMIKRLIQLCHPDKHGGSEMAKTMTTELLKMRTRA